MARTRVLLFDGRTPAARSPLGAAMSARLATYGVIVDAFHDAGTLEAQAPQVSPPGVASVLVVGPDAATPFACARRLSRIVPDLRVLFAVDPDREAALRREAIYGAPPGGRWTLVAADSPDLEARLRAEMQLAEQHRRMRTTVDRMKLRLAAPLPQSVDAGEYRRLVASDRYLASVLRHANDAIVSLDRQATIVSWNSGAERLFGLSWDAARGRRLDALFREPPQVAALVDGALAGEAHNAGLEIGNDDVRYVDATFSPLADETGGALGVVAILRDATERHRAEQDVRSSSRQKDEFLAMLAHELRNPLAPIRNATQIVQLLHGGDARTQAATAIIARQTDHLAALLDDLLDVARVTRGAVVLKREPVEVDEVLSDAVEQARMAIDARSHRLVIVPHPAAHVLGDRKRLTQVVANLLLNAARYTPDGGTITVDVATCSDQVRIAVADTGIGIERDLIGTIFELFVQAQRSPDRAQGGLGIGLALVKSLVELHGGSVRVESDGPGHGSTFTVLLPAEAPPSAGHALASLPVPSRARSRLQVMVVDDNADAAHTLGAVLDAIGYDTQVHTDAHVALDRAAAGTCDVFILDIGMPYVDGYEFARRLRRMGRHPAPTLIALTGYGSPDDRERATKAGFDHHMVKPVDTSALASLLHSIESRVFAGQAG